VSHYACDACGSTIARRDSHVLLKDNSVVCMRHYKSSLDAGQVVTVLTREQVLDRLQPSLRRPRGPEMR
jgi:hypothetical protein